MPPLPQHIEKAEQNENFYQSFDLDNTQYRDWVVNGIFYSGLHYIEAYLATKGKHSADHKERNGNINSDENLQKYIFQRYMSLKDDSEGARYRMQVFTPGEIKQDIIPKLDQIKEYLKKYIPQIRLA